MLKLVFVASRPYIFLLSTFSCSFFLFSLFFSVLLRHPPSFSPSLVFVGTIFWHVFSHSHSSLSLRVDDLFDLQLYVFVPSVCGSDSTGQWSALLLWLWFISLVTTVHATTCLSSWLFLLVLPLFQTVVLLKDQKPEIYLNIGCCWPLLC